jgi:hypothetical protein
MQVPATLKKFAHMIDEVEDDRGNQNGWWVHLKNGWINTFSETHMIHEDTLAECAVQLAQDVEPCVCRDCGQASHRAPREAVDPGA